MAKPAKEPLPQVFINFRGDELRHKFVKNLARVLRESGVNVFIDNYERKGRRLQNLFTRIKKSTIALAIFSERYCESKWCLDELVLMNKQMEEKKLVVIPIFFNVRADEVKRAANPNRKRGGEDVLDGNFTVLFKETKKKYAEEEPERIERWEYAMRSVTERIGFSRSNYTNEMYLASDIVKEVKRQLHMPVETDWSNADVAFLALFLDLIFSFILAPRYFPDQKFFKTPEWFLGFLVLVLVCRIWYKKNQNNLRSTSFYAVCLCVVFISSVFILIWVFKDDLVGFLYRLKLSA